MSDEEVVGQFRAQVSDIDEKKYLLTVLEVSFTTWDGKHVEGYEGHVCLFEPYDFILAGARRGDIVEFSARAYYYVRKGKPKSEDYSLKDYSDVVIMEKDMKNRDCAILEITKKWHKMKHREPRTTYYYKKNAKWQ